MQTDQMEFPRQFPVTAQLGLHPQLAQLEMLVNPTVEALLAADNLANPARWRSCRWSSPLTLFVWSKSRVVPVRVTELSVTEEAFDVALNPIRAKVEPRPARAECRRSRLRSEGRPPVHQLSAREGATGLEAHAGGA